MLRRNLLIYGVGGIIAPFIGIKLIDLLIQFIPGISLMRLPAWLSPAPRRAARAARPHRADRHRSTRWRSPAVAQMPGSAAQRRRLAGAALDGTPVGSALDRPVVHRHQRQPARAVLPDPSVRRRRRVRPDRHRRVEPRPGERRRHPARPGEPRTTPGKPSLLTQVCARSLAVGAARRRRRAPARTAPPTGSARCSAVFHRDGAHRPGHPGGQPQPGLPGHAVHRDRTTGVAVECATFGEDYSTGVITPIRGDAPATSAVPADAVTASGSGLDPDISPGLRRAAGATGRQGPRCRRSPRCTTLVDAVHDRPRTRVHGRAGGQRRSSSTSPWTSSTRTTAEAVRRGPTAGRRQAMATRTAARLPRGRPRRRQDLHDARGGPPAPRPRHRRRRRLRRDATAARTPRRMLDDLEVVPRQDDHLPRHDVHRDGPRRRPRPRPEVVLVDELAHTNVPGSRNAKRWQDIQELLDAGITVITTVNIQHLESLNDVVEQITGVPQRETVPDEVVRRAEQIELVDMTPEALRRRMAHGNVYRPGEGRRRARQLLPGRQPHRAARAGPALAGRQGRRRARPLPGRTRHRRRPGRPASGSWSR